MYFTLRKLRGQSRSRLQRGSAMVEFVVVGPIITVLGMAILQYSMLFFAKSQINHATFMAARAGSVAHANLNAIQDAYKRALIPLYGGGQNTAELALAFAKVNTDVTPNTLRVEILNPTKESFDDYATNQELNDKFNARAIPNTGIGLKSTDELEAVKPNSGQSIQDANLLKIRITHGYLPKVWLMGLIYKKYLQWLDTEEDNFKTQLIDSGRIPVVAHVTLEMHSEAVENKDSNGNSLYASNPGIGNNGQPKDPGDPRLTDKDPPLCATMGCSVSYTPADPGSGGGGGGTGGGTGGTGGSNCSGSSCPVCPGKST